MTGRWNIAGAWGWLDKLALALAGLLLVAGLAAAWWSEQLYKEQKLREIAVQADILAASITAALAFDDAAAAQESVDALRANPEIEAAGAYDGQGLVASYSGDGLPGPPVGMPTLSAYFQTGRPVVAAPVMQEGTRLGGVYLRGTSLSAANRLFRYGPIALMAFMAALVVSILTVAHAVLRKANADLDQRARALAAANDELQVQIDERRRAEEALRQSQKMEAMGQLTGGVAHDFNNLLMAVTSGLRLLDRTDDPDKRASISEGIKQAADRGSRLTRQLLAFARRQTLKPESINPADHIGAMRELLQRSLREDIGVEIDVPDDVWPIEVDPGQLELVIINLAVNARDAMPKGGVVTIAGRNVPASAPGEADMVELSVRDTGVGMDAETLERAFEPFFTTKDVHKGTGLGLSQAYGFASQSNGAARIESTPGEGSAIFLLLPRAHTPPAPKQAAAEPDTTERGPRMSILLVEDDDAVASVVCALVADLGHDCTHVTGPRAALEALRGGEFDIVFSDIVMPGGMNGLELARLLRKEHPDLPVLLTTGYSETAHTEGGEFPILRKPYTPEELELRLEEARAGRGGKPGQA